jgi:hypothetical protein
MTPQEDFERVGAELADLGVRISKMFGKPAYKNADGKTFGCLYQDSLACRLVQGSAEHKAALDLPGARLFDPSGRERPMKDWVCVPHAGADRWSEFAEAAQRIPR